MRSYDRQTELWLPYFQNTKIPHSSTSSRATKTCQPRISWLLPNEQVYAKKRNNLRRTSSVHLCLALINTCVKSLGPLQIIHVSWSGHGLHSTYSAMEQFLDSHLSPKNLDSILQEITPTWFFIKLALSTKCLLSCNLDLMWMVRWLQANHFEDDHGEQHMRSLRHKHRVIAEKIASLVLIKHESH